MMRKKIVIDHSQHQTLSSEPKSMSRRGLFRGMAKKAGEVNEAVRKEPIKRHAPRPPTCAEEAILDSLCDGCGACVDACEQRVLSLVDGKPQLHLDCNYCTDCRACEKACPTGALSNTSQSTGVIPVFSDTCQRMVFGACQACQSSCERGSISASEKKPSVDKSSCNGCGECRTSCPMSAISFEITTIYQ